MTIFLFSGLLFFLNIYLCICYEFSYSHYNSFINHNTYNKQLDELINSKNYVQILTSKHHSLIKENLIKLKCLNEHVNYASISYKDLIFKNYNENCDFLYINDFLVDNRNKMHEKEKEFILEYNEIPKLILNVEHTDQVVFKYDDFLNKIKTHHFKEIDSHILMNYIYDMINYYKYDEHLYHIKWYNYIDERFGFEDIEDLIFKIHLMLKINKKCSMNTIEKLIYAH